MLIENLGKKNFDKAYAIIKDLVILIFLIKSYCFRKKKIPLKLLKKLIIKNIQIYCPF